MLAFHRVLRLADSAGDDLDVLANQIRDLEGLNKSKTVSVEFPWKSKNFEWGKRQQPNFRTHLVGVDNDLALFLITAGDEEHVVERGRVVEDRVVLERGQNVAAAELEEVHTALVDGEPEGLRPV